MRGAFGEVVCRCGPYSGVAFFSFDFYKGLLSEALPEFPKMARFWAGALAGASAVLATYPLDVLNTRKTVAETRLSYRQVGRTLSEGRDALVVASVCREKQRMASFLRRWERATSTEQRLEEPE